MRPYERLADNEFEELVGDLIGSEEERIYERFRRGADLGIDLRHIERGRIQVIQCKHYRSSSFSKLKSAAKKEVARLEKLDPAPSSYRFATSRDLTPANKKTIAEILKDWVTGPQDVLGGGDIDALLDAHPEVERRHVKLWLPGGTALATVLNADVFNRSRVLLERIDKVLPLYVQTDGFLTAHEKLSGERVCVISGPPGIGKTTLAQMLVSDAINQGYEPIEVSRDIEEAWRVLDTETPQVFYYDDFLGTTTLGELEKNEDQRLVSFIAAVAERRNALFILTTREYIYQQARALYESFDRAGIDARRFLLTLSSYGRLDRARILYNHVFHAAELPDEARHSLAEGEAYWRIVGHRHFNPRLIETFTNGYTAELAAEGVCFVDYAVSVLDDPELLWRRVYENQITDRERVLLLTLVTMPLPARLDDLRVAFESLGTERGLSLESHDFEAALEVLDDSLIATDRIEKYGITNFLNPSIEDFIRRRMSASRRDIEIAISAAVYFEQLSVLWPIIESRTDPQEFLVQLIGACLGEPFERETASWRPIKDAVYGYRRLERSPLNLELRLGLVFDLLELAPVCEEFERLQEAACARFEDLRARWRNGVGIARSAIELIGKLAAPTSSVSLPVEALEDLKRFLIETAATPEDYRQLLIYREAIPEVFDEKDGEEIIDRFRSDATDELTYNVEEIRSLEELEEFGIVAEELGIELDSELIDSARREVEEGLSHAEAAYEMYEEGRGGGSSFTNEAAEIDALFSRLSD